MKKFLKVLGITLGVLVIVVFIALIFLLKSLPSPAEIGRYIKPSNVKTTLKEAHKTEKADTAKTATAAPSASPTPTTDDNKTMTYQLKNEEDQKLLADLMDERKPLSNVCASLDNAGKSRLNGYSFKEFGERYKQSVLGDERDRDPLIQSIKPTLRYLFSETSLKDLVAEAQEAADRGEDDSLMNKAGFYAKAYAAYREILSNRDQINNIMDRSYHLMILSKVVAKKPELLSDNRVHDYCSEIENALNGSNPISWVDEREEFNKFMDYSGVDPKEVGYDPNYRTQVKVEYSKKGVQVHGGWIDSLLKPSPEEIKALEAEAPK